MGFHSFHRNPKAEIFGFLWDFKKSVMVKPSRRRNTDERGAPPMQRPWVTSRAPGGWQKLVTMDGEITTWHNMFRSMTMTYIISIWNHKNVPKQFEIRRFWTYTMNIYESLHFELCSPMFPTLWHELLENYTNIEVDIITSICGNLESSGRLALRSMTPHTGLVSIVLCNAVQLWTNRSGKRKPETRSGLKKWDGSRFTNT